MTTPTTHRRRNRSNAPKPIPLRDRVFTLTTGAETLFRCSHGASCLVLPQAEVVVTYQTCPDVATLWCQHHLPNVQLLSKHAARVEVRSTLGRFRLASVPS